jgi:hypothetical protein
MSETAETLRRLFNDSTNVMSDCVELAIALNDNARCTCLSADFNHFVAQQIQTNAVNLSRCIK